MSVHAILVAIKKAVSYTTRRTGITYTQSSVYSTNAAATYSNMNDDSADESVSTETGTNSSGSEWVKADQGSSLFIEKIIIGYDYLNNLPGGWGVSYTEGKTIETSDDNTNWTNRGTTPTYSGTGSTDGLVSINIGVTARYIRITSSGYMCLTEFSLWY